MLNRGINVQKRRRMRGGGGGGEDRFKLSGAALTVEEATVGRPFTLNINLNHPKQREDGRSQCISVSLEDAKGRGGALCRRSSRSSVALVNVLTQHVTAAFRCRTKRPHLHFRLANLHIYSCVET